MNQCTTEPNSSAEPSAKDGQNSSAELFGQLAKSLGPPNTPKLHIFTQKNSRKINFEVEIDKINHFELEFQLVWYNQYQLLLLQHIQKYQNKSFLEAEVWPNCPAELFGSAEPRFSLIGRRSYTSLYTFATNTWGFNNEKRKILMKMGAKYSIFFQTAKINFFAANGYG